MELLKADNITKTYSKIGEQIQVLRGLTITIYSGEILVLMGPSGSGKSTLLNILGTLDTDYTGNILINGNHLMQSSDFSEIRRNILGFVFQFHHLLPEFTIYENLLVPKMIAKLQTEDNDSFILDMLNFVGLGNRINHYPDEISGGERQRIAVLRSLVNKPLLVLADEPTGNLDRENSIILLKLMSDLREKYQQSFLIATHDYSVTQIADRVLNLKDGKIIEEKNRT